MMMHRKKKISNISDGCTSQRLKSKQMSESEIHNRCITFIFLDEI